MMKLPWKANSVLLDKISVSTCFILEGASVMPYVHYSMKNEHNWSYSEIQGPRFFAIDLLEFNMCKTHFMELRVSIKVSHK